MCCAWSCCALFSLAFSISSAISVGWGGIAAGVFSVILITQTGIESINTFSAEKGQHRLLPLLLTGTVAASLFIVTANETQWFIRQNHTFVVENIVSHNDYGQALDVKLLSGPLKGIYTNKKTAGIYDAMIRDLDTIKGLTDPNDRVFVCNLAPFCYLHMDRGYATYSTWFLYSEFFRLELYWHEHPDKIPEYIYFPYCDMYSYQPYEKWAMMTLREQLNRLVEYDSIQGEAGETYHVTKSN